jgi:hypothetical protein
MMKRADGCSSCWECRFAKHSVQTFVGKDALTIP